MKSNNETIYDLAVIGGGPSGMMAAGRAAERNLKVILIEKNASLGKKLLITGGGRCNVTNAEMDNRTLLSKFKESDKFLFSAFSQHSVAETLDFFHGRGMPTKIEEGKRVFPASDSAKSVFETLLQYLNTGNVTIKSNSEVIGFDTEPLPESLSESVSESQPKPLTEFLPTSTSIKKITAVRIKGGETIFAKSFVLATGGKSHPETGSTGEGFAWLSKLGHTIITPSASLVPVKVKDLWVKKLSGVSMSDAKLTLFQNGIKVSGKQSVIRGKILFTHFGLSGPAILNISSEIGELLKYGELVLSLDLLPNHDYATLNLALQKLFAEENNKKFKNAIIKLIPTAFGPIVIEKSGINPDLPCNSVTREDRLNLVKILKDIHIHPTGLLGTDKAIITSGGVSLKEIDFKTMRSRIILNLYLIGDVLDVDRPSGGYSLQLCWTTGWVAGNSA
ncbi:MAG: aminoacetone oxidase family FAD-binding enzyme [Candidatus Paceibacterota bacterium]